VANPPSSGRRDTGDDAPGPWAYLGLGVEIALPVVLCMYAGHRLDLWLGSQPWLLVVGGLVGMAVGFYSLFRRVLGTGKGQSGSGR
jgi:F0F1-type ATP synthase assembly protein I